MAALHIKAPEWVHANILQPAGLLPPAAAAFQHAGNLPIAALLPAFNSEDVVLGAPVGRGRTGEVAYGSVRGRDAVIKTASLNAENAGWSSQPRCATVYAAHWRRCSYF